MLNKTKLAVTCGLMALMAGACVAQSEGDKAGEPKKYFHLDFVVKELESGKVVNARHYTTTISTGEPGTSGIRTGSKVPITTRGTIPDTQLTYIDLGVSFDCRAAKEIGGDLALNVSAEISSAASTSNPPMIRQNKWSSNVLVPVTKPTVIFSSDDVSDKGQIQVELTATPVR